MGDYSGNRATTLRLLTKFGKSVAFEREESGSVYDPVTGTSSGGSTLILTGVGVILNFSQHDIDNASILSDDKKMLYQGDALNVDDKYGEFSIYHLSNLDPDESGTILTTVQLRK